MIGNLTKSILVMSILLLIVYTLKWTLTTSAPLDLMPHAEYLLLDQQDSEILLNPHSLHTTYNWLPYSNFQHNPEANQKVLWLKLDTPLLEYNSGIYMSNIIGKQYTLYTSQGQVLTTSRNQDNNFNNEYLLLPLSAKFSRETLYLKIQLSNYKSNRKEHIYIDDFHKLSHLHDTKNILHIYFAVFFLILGIFILLVSLNLHKRLRITFYAASLYFLTVSILLGYSETNLIHYLENYDDYLYIVASVSFLSISFLLTLLYKSVVIPLSAGTWFRRWNRLITVYTLVALIGFIFNQLRDNNIYYANFIANQINFYTIALTCLVLLLFAIHHHKESIENASYIIIGFFHLFYAIFLESLVYWINDYAYGDYNIWKYGVISLSIMFIIVVYKQYITNQNQYSELANQLLSIKNPSPSDFMTRLPSQVQSLENITYAIEKYTFSKKPFSIALCDLDTLTEINNQYGSHFGDQILYQLARDFLEFTGHNHFVGRWKSDEFIFVFYNVSDEAAFKLAETLRKKIKFTTFRYKEQMVHITATIGIHSYKGNASLNATLEKLYQALYFGQHHGYDTTISFEEINYTDTKHNLLQ